MTTLDDIIHLTTRVERLETESRELRGVLDQHLEMVSQLTRAVDLLTGRVENLARATAHVRVIGGGRSW